MSIINAILFVFFLTVLTFAEATPLSAQYSASELSVTSDATRPIDQWASPALDKGTFEIDRRSSMIELDDLDERGLSKSTCILLLVKSGFSLTFQLIQESLRYGLGLHFSLSLQIIFTLSVKPSANSANKILLDIQPTDLLQPVSNLPSHTTINAMPNSLIPTKTATRIK